MSTTLDVKPTSPYEWVGRATAGTLLAVALVTNYLGMWNFRNQTDDVRAQLAEARKERDEWKVLALKSLTEAESANHIRLMAPDPSVTTLEDAKERLENVERIDD